MDNVHECMRERSLAERRADENVFDGNAWGGGYEGACGALCPER